MPGGVGAADNYSHGMDGGVFDLILLHEIIEGASILVMRKLYTRNIKRDRFKLFCLFNYLIKGNVDKLSLFVNKSADEPGTGNTVDLWTFTGDPFHGR